jgi:hypothetical protein
VALRSGVQRSYVAKEYEEKQTVSPVLRVTRPIHEDDAVMFGGTVVNKIK